VLLKPLENALRDGDPVLAVVKSTATGNCAGRPADSLLKAQLIARNLSRAGVHPRSVSYVETAASGNAVVDASEIDALRDVFEEFDVAPGTCAIGSAKSYMGHALSVSGLSQLTRVVMQLSRGRLLPGFHPAIPVDFLARTPFCAGAEEREWCRPVATMGGTPAEQPRRALINSYGGGGAMVSVLLEEAPGEARVSAPEIALSPRELVVLSARSMRQLLASIEQLLLFLDEQSQVSLQSLAFTLQIGREPMEHRWAAVVGGIDELKAALLATLMDPSKPGVAVMIASASDGAELLSIEQLNACAAERLLKKVATHWVNGGSLDWRTLWRTPPRRICAPSYPFQVSGGRSE
jgi:polyketide synthase PksN